MCLAKFAVNYNVTQAHDEFIDMQETDAHELSETDEYDSCTKIRLKEVLDIYRKGNKKQFCVLQETNCKQSQKSTIMQN